MAKPKNEPEVTAAKRNRKSQSAQVSDLQDSVHAKASDEVADDLKPIGDALKPLAMDALAAKQRDPAPKVGDPLNPTVVRGDNADMIGHFKTSTKDQLHKLARQYESKKSDAQGKAAEIGNLLTKAEETQNLDTWCFKEAMKWDRMSADKLVRRLPTFIKYLQDLEVVQKATAQGDLLAEVERTEQQAQTDIEAKNAATGLAPARKPSMRIVPKDGEPDSKLH